MKAPESRRSSRHAKRRRKRATRIVVGVLVAVLAVVGIGAGIGAWYLNSVNSKMALGETADEIKEALVVAEENQPFYMLVLGIDMREGAAEERVLATHPDYDPNAAHGSDGDAKSDAIMLVRIDPYNSQVSLLTVPRDTPYVDDEGAIRKLNSSYSMGGATETMKAVKQVTGMDVSHYAEVSGSDLVTAVDGLGGITVDVPISFDWTTTTGEQVHLDAGLQHVTGEQALALGGMRTLYSGKGIKKDHERQSATRAVVKGIIDAVLSRPAFQIPGAVSDIASCVKTDLSVNEIVDLAREMGTDVTIYAGTGPYNGKADPYALDEAPSDGSEYPWLCYVDDEGWERVVKAFKKGEDISDMDYSKDLVHYAGQPEDTWSRGLVKPEEL